MNNLYYLAPAIIPVNICEKIIQRGLELPAQNASIGFDNDHIDNSYRVSTIRWFYGPDNKDIVDLITHHATMANREHFGFDISIGAHEFQFTEYHGNSNGKYDWHHDVWWTNPRAHDRKLSVVIQLSNPMSYQGGDFEFGEPCDFNSQNFKPQGSVLVFPSFFRHKVNAVTSGTRYSLVSWVDGPKFR
jgi:PKHD-type hydroxylase